MSTVQDPRKTWLATGSLLAVWWRMQSLVPRLPLAFWLWLSPAYLSASGGGEGQVRSQLALLWYPLSPLFCERVRLCLRAFHGKFLSLSLSLSLSPFSLWLSQFRLLSHIVLRLSSKLPQIVLRAFRPGPYPKYATQASLPVQPPLAAGGRKRLGYFPTGSCN